MATQFKRIASGTAEDYDTVKVTLALFNDTASDVEKLGKRKVWLVATPVNAFVNVAKLTLANDVLKTYQMALQLK